MQTFALQEDARTRHATRTAFTLVELLVVIAVISILAGIILPAIRHVRERARQTHCINALHQFSVAWSTYRNEHDEESPDWLSSLYPAYLDDPELYVCPSDSSAGADGGKPPDAYNDPRDAFDEVDDNDSHPEPYYNRNGDIHACSYFYEFCAAPCTWDYRSWLSYGTNYVTDRILSPNDPVVSWGDVKWRQLMFGDQWHQGPYGANEFPVIRCFHHHAEQRVTVNDPVKGSTTEGVTLNVGFAGNVFRAPMTWELLKDSDLW